MVLNNFCQTGIEMAKVINKRKSRNFLLNEKPKITAIDNKRSIKADPKSG